jgi:hypothetical protein
MAIGNQAIFLCSFWLLDNVEGTTALDASQTKGNN